MVLRKSAYIYECSYEVYNGMKTARQPNNSSNNVVLFALETWAALLLYQKYALDISRSSFISHSFSQLHAIQRDLNLRFYSRLMKFTEYWTEDIFCTIKPRLYILARDAILVVIAKAGAVWAWFSCKARKSKLTTISSVKITWPANSTKGKKQGELLTMVDTLKSTIVPNSCRRR